MALPCTDCHVAIDISTTNLAGTRKMHNNSTLVIAGDRAKYKEKFNLTKNVNSTTRGRTRATRSGGFGIACHSLAQYKAHVSYEGSPRGCQDCHDEHGGGFRVDLEHLHDLGEVEEGRLLQFGLGDPERRRKHQVSQAALSAEPYDALRHALRLLRADGTGVCDNTECHGTTWSATQPGPLSELMTNSRHSMGDQSAGIDCETCHTHDDPQGGVGASAACDDCHGTPAAPNTTGIARTHTDTNESATYHDKHTASILISDCNDCHVHNGKTVSPVPGRT